MNLKVNRYASTLFKLYFMITTQHYYHNFIFTLLDDHYSYITVINI